MSSGFSRATALAFLICYLAIFLPLAMAAERHLFGWQAEALTGTIDADRPGFSTSPQTVSIRRLQIEAGYQFTKDRRVDNHELPFLLIRAGLTKKVELRVNWDGLSWMESNGGFQPDASDIDVGLKANLVEQAGLLPNVGLLGSLSLPTGNGEATSNRVDPTGGLLWSYNLAADVELFGTVLMSSVTGERGRFFEAANAVGVSLPISDRLGTFAEYFGFYRDGGGGGAEHHLNGGFTYLLHDNLQLDINGGFGINARADDYFLGTGLAFRF
jgi:hypothetical protein